MRPSWNQRRAIPVVMITTFQVGVSGVASRSRLTTPTFSGALRIVSAMLRIGREKVVAGDAHYWNIERIPKTPFPLSTTWRGGQGVRLPAPAMIPAHVTAVRPHDNHARCAINTWSNDDVWCRMVAVVIRAR